MNSLPRLKQLAAELASRDCVYEPVLADIEMLVAQGVSSGAISRAVYLNLSYYPVEGLGERESSDLVKEIGDSLAASLVNCVGRDPGSHEEISRLLEKLELVTG